jgi:hypothetical protein
MMPSLTFNEFQRELRKRELDPKLEYLFTMLYEQQAEIIKQQDLLGQALLDMTGTVASFVKLHEATQKKVMQIARQGRPEGVDVFSVANDPDDR